MDFIQLYATHGKDTLKKFDCVPQDLLEICLVLPLSVKHGYTTKLLSQFLLISQNQNLSPGFRAAGIIRLYEELQKLTLTPREFPEIQQIFIDSLFSIASLPIQSPTKDIIESLLKKMFSYLCNDLDFPSTFQAMSSLSSIFSLPYIFTLPEPDLYTLSNYQEVSPPKLLEVLLKLCAHMQATQMPSSNLTVIYTHGFLTYALEQVANPLMLTQLKTNIDKFYAIFSENQAASITDAYNSLLHKFHMSAPGSPEFEALLTNVIHTLDSKSPINSEETILEMNKFKETLSKVIFTKCQSMCTNRALASQRSWEYLVQLWKDHSFFSKKQISLLESILSRREKKNQPPKRVSFREPIQIDSGKLDQLSTKAIEKIGSYCATHNDSSKINEAIACLRQDSKTLFPGSILRPFGSCPLGLWVSGSPVDINISDSKSNADEALSLLYQSLSEKPNISIQQGPQELIVTYQNINVTLKIKVNSWIDQTCKDLIRKYLDMDARVNHLILFFKIWAKSQNLSLSGFHLSLLVITFLQTLENPVLSPIQIAPHEPKLTEGYDIWFDSQFKNHTENRSTLGYLIILLFETLSEEGYMFDPKEGKKSPTEMSGFPVVHPITGDIMPGDCEVQLFQDTYLMLMSREDLDFIQINGVN